jgi:hypothetical protein
MEKSPLLANGYNPPPTHLNPMQFMALNHAAQQAAAAAQHALLGSPSSAMHQAGLPTGLGLTGGNHHGLTAAAQSQASANFAAHHSAAASSGAGLGRSTAESDDGAKGSSSVVDPMVAARYTT